MAIASTIMVSWRTGRKGNNDGSATRNGRKVVTAERTLTIPHRPCGPTSSAAQQVLSVNIVHVVFGKARAPVSPPITTTAAGRGAAPSHQGNVACTYRCHKRGRTRRPWLQMHPAWKF